MYLKDKSEILNIRISSDLLFYLKYYSKKNNMSISKFVRFILTSYLISLKEITYDNKKRYIHDFL